MAKDDALHIKLAELAASGSGLQFERLTSTDAATALDLSISRSPNPIYHFRIEGDAENFDAVAFTLILNGAGRPATRAEALGQAIASNGAALFAHNPFLLIFDFNAARFMAVSAAKLFGAFAREAAGRSLPYSDSASFSLTPSFDHRTVSMYATVTGADIWWCGDIADLTKEELLRGLRQIWSESKTADVDAIIDAVAGRLAAAPTPRSSQGDSHRTAVLPVNDMRSNNGVIELDPRIWRMIITSIRSSPAVILVGPPGTGKTELLRQAIQSISDQPGLVGAAALNAPLWATPDESWTARELVGGDTIIKGEIAFRPGWVARAIEEDRWLVLDEANRADMDRIFGSLLTWLSGGCVAIGSEHSASRAREIQIGWQEGASAKLTDAGGVVLYAAGSSWRLLGTYNALDAQRVFRFGQALGRRFVRVPIPAAAPEQFEQILEGRTVRLDASMSLGVAQLYRAHYQSDATLLGPALFLAMCDYLDAASDDSIALRLPNGQEQDARPANVKDALAEAYVVHIGTWLAQLEEADFDALKKRSLEFGTFDQEAWAWISSMLGSLA